MARGTGLEDAIGKYHEAVTIEELARRFPLARDKSTRHYPDVKTQFGPLVARAGLTPNVDSVAAPTADEVLSYIASAFNTSLDRLTVTSFQLASESYRSNRLDSTDIIIEVGIGRHLQVFQFSLKAIQTEGSFPCVRNPGLRQLVKKQYFDCGNIDDLIADVRQRFHSGLLDYPPSYKHSPKTMDRHANALILATRALYSELRKAPNASIAKGVAALLGNIPVVVANYETQHVQIESLPSIRPPFTVSLQPTPIHTSIEWNGHNRLDIRTKFASGTSQEYLDRWSSLKAAVTLHVT